MFTELNIYDEALPYLSENDLEKVFETNIGDMAVFRNRLETQQILVPKIETEKKNGPLIDYRNVKETIVRIFFFFQ